MTSQLRQNLLASQGLHGANEVTILLAFMVPKLLLLFTAAGWSVQPYSINF